MHLFEFMDQDWVPASIRDTMRDILECGNSWPFRRYNDWVVAEIVRIAHERGATQVVELGAGTAPLTRHMLQCRAADGLQLIPCDSNPDVDRYRELETASGGRVKPVYEPVDFSKPHEWPKNAVLVLSATLHHVPPAARTQVLDAMRANGNHVLIFEPLRHNFWSMAFVGLSLVPAAITPVRFLGRAGRLRRALWCWLLPVAPLMFLWDGFVSCLRQWTRRDWERRLSPAEGRDWIEGIQSKFFSQFVEISGGAR